MEQTIKQVERKRLDPEKTRMSILAAAIKTFASMGYEGASIGVIAAAAKVPKSLVQYHFGNKEELWQACLSERAAPVIRALDQFLDDEAGDPRVLLEARFRFLKENPDIRRLLGWAGMGGCPTPAFIRDRRHRLMGKLHGRADRPEFARFLTAMAAMDGWFLFRNMYAGPLGDIVLQEETEQRVVEFLLAMVGGPECVE